MNSNTNLDKKVKLKTEEKKSISILISIIIMIIWSILWKIYEFYTIDNFSYNWYWNIQKISDDEIYEGLISIKSELDKKIPLVLGGGVTLFSITIDWKTKLVYNYYLPNDWDNIDELQKSKNELNFKYSVCNNFRTYFIYWAWIIYNYYNQENILIKSFEFNSSNC